MKDMNDVKRLFNIATSLCELNGRTPERIDLQAFHVGEGFDGFVLYLDADDRTFRIRTDGTFEER